MATGPAEPNARPPAGWRRLDHTSDLKLEFTAADLENLFRAAADGLFAEMLDRDAVRPARREAVSVESAVEGSPPASSSPVSGLFLDWLRELLFLFAVRGYAVARVVSLKIDPNGPRLSAELAGEDYDPERHGLRVEVKSPTYHGFVFERSPAGWRAVVLFDV